MKKGGKFGKIAWRVAVGVALLGWIFQMIFYHEARVAREALGLPWAELTRWERLVAAWVYGPSGLWNTLASIKPAALALSVLLMGLTIVLGLLRWQMVLRVHGLNLSLARTAEISFIAHFFNSFLLGSTGGDLLKAYYAARETHHKKTEAVMTVIVDRMLGLWSMLLFACLMMIPNLQLLWSHPRLRILAWFTIAMAAACTSLVGVSFWGGVSKRLPKARDWLRRLPKGEMLERSLEACREFGRSRRFLFEAMIISLALNIICVLQIQTIIVGFNLRVPFMALALIVPIIICISALPVTPSGLGVRENLYVLMLAAPGLDIPATQALVISLLAYAGSLFWSVVGGVVYLSRKEKEHLDEITAENEAATE